MKTTEFETELKRLHPDFNIKINLNIPALSSLQWKGEHICTVPTGDILEDPSELYGVILPNGMFSKHRSRKEALAIANKLLLDMTKDQNHADATLGRGKYSKENLNK